MVSKKTESLNHFALHPTSAFAFSLRYPSLSFFKTNSTGQLAYDSVDRMSISSVFLLFYDRRESVAAILLFFSLSSFNVRFTS